MACAIEDAGFEVRDMIEWVYGSGFPKSLNIGKAVKALQETGGSSPRNLRKSRMGEEYEPTGQEDYRKGRMFSSEIKNDNIKEEINNEYEGWGTALKPAHEPICMARKPLQEKTVAENCLKWGTGGINIDESRVGLNGEKPPTGSGNKSNGATGIDFHGGNKEEGNETSPLGRFPANLIHDNSEEVRECFPETNKQAKCKSDDKSGWQTEYVGGEIKAPVERKLYLDEQNGGNASRFFKSIIYQAKASKSERNKGLD
jgi:site-specific DNA-methyltransferase (adenine-specific)